MKIPQTFCSGMLFHRFDVRILAGQTTFFDAWLGAVLRNNLLYAAGQIDLKDEGTTLFQACCKQLPLTVSHPLYKEMEHGFPPPFYLYTPVIILDKESSHIIRKNEVLSFTLVLAGDFVQYVSFFTQAIRYMCRKGMGVDPMPFSLIDVHEVSASGESRLLASGDEDISGYLSYPMKLADFESAMPERKGFLRIVFESPVSLMKQRRTSGVAGYQEKSNGFPGFYQLVRSAAFRMEKLTALYYSSDDIAGYMASHKAIDSYIEGAAVGVWLDDVCLQRVTYQSTRKEDTDKRFLFTGYTGEMTFYGHYKLPKQKETTPKALSHEDFEKIRDLEIDEKRVSHIITRDLFLFACYTGTSYADTVYITQENIFYRRRRQLVVKIPEKEKRAAGTC